MDVGAEMGCILSLIVLELTPSAIICHPTSDRHEVAFLYKNIMED